MEKIIQKRLLNKGIKKPRLKSNPGVVLIGLQTTRPRPLAGKHCSKAKKHPYWSTNNESMLAGLWCQVKRTYSTPLKWVITTKCTILCPLRISWDTCLWFQWRTSLPFTDFKNIRTYKRKVFIKSKCYTIILGLEKVGKTVVKTLSNELRGQVLF